MEQEKNYFNKIDETTTEVVICGNISKQSLLFRFFGIQAESPDYYSLQDGLKKIDTPNLLIRINSPGGSLFEGLAMYQILSEFKGKKTTVVDGVAASAASIIFMVGNERIVPSSGLLMIHNPWTYTEGDKNEMRKTADFLDEVGIPAVNIYMEKTGLSEEKIKEMMDEETWMSSQKALELGFATSIERDEVSQNIDFSKVLAKLVQKNEALEAELKQFENNKKEKNAWDSFYFEKKD